MEIFQEKDLTKNKDLIKLMLFYYTLISLKSGFLAEIVFKFEYWHIYVII